jgi:RNA polymerase sigma factor (sigma-70 family)
VTIDQFSSLIAQHQRGLVRFARWRFSCDGARASDIVQVTLQRVIEKGVYLKYQAEEDLGPRAPRWLRKAVENTGRHLERRDGNRARLDRTAARESLAERGLKVDVAKGADHEAGTRTQLEVGDTVRDSWAIVDKMIEDERPIRTVDVPAEIYEPMLDVYGHGLTWEQAAAKAGIPVERLKKRAQRAIAKLRAKATR